MDKPGAQALLVGVQAGVATEENSLAVTQKVKHRVTITLSNSAPRNMTKRNENIRPIETCTQIFTATLFIPAKNWKTPKNVLQLRNGCTECGPATPWNSTVGNTDEP